MSAKDKIEKILRRAFSVHHIEIQDDSSQHAGHAEAKKSGGGHFSVLIVSPDFEGKKTMQRHRMIHNILQKEMKEGIHALALKTLTPQEYHRP